MTTAVNPTAPADSVTPPRTLGTTYVVDPYGVVVAAADQNIDKNGEVHFNFSTALGDIYNVSATRAAQIEDLAGLHDSGHADLYYVGVKTTAASAKIRLGTTLEGTNENARHKWVGAYTQQTVVPVGTVGVFRGADDNANAIGYSYTPTISGDGFGFYYSLNPINDTGSAGEGVAASYGDIEVVISKTAF